MPESHNAPNKSLGHRLEQMRADLKKLAQDFIAEDSVKEALAALAAAQAIATFRDTIEQYSGHLDETDFEPAEVSDD